MAKDDKGKIRFVIFELEGSNETLQESMRTVVQALGRPVTTPQRLLPPTIPATVAGNAVPQLTIVDEPTEDVEEVPASPASKKPSKPSKQHHAKPKTLELDLITGDTPMKTYCQELNPQSHILKYLVVASWFKRYRNLDAITIDHVYTCYLIMKWNVPVDVGQCFRQGKMKGWYDSGPTRGWYAMNHIGQNQINDMEGGG